MPPAGEPVQCTGIVKRWTPEKGYGFLLPDGGGDDVFVHRSELVSQSDLTMGEKVRFQKADDGKQRGKFKALRVSVTGPATDGGLFADLPSAPEAAVAAWPLTGMDLLLDIAGEAGTAARAAVEPFVLMSSLQCPFLVLSESQLVAGVREPSPDEFDRLALLVDAFVAGCETQRAVMLADFEGEMPGHGGELTTAQFQLTAAVDAATLAPRSLPAGQRFQGPGLLVDMRSARCVAAIRRLMESRTIIKLLWGGDGDCQSLMYQALPVPLQMNPAAVIDAQTAFDSRSRLGMARMLETVDPLLLAGIPEKEQIDWDAFHSQNRKALLMPLDARSAAYAVDDLHRIEAIVASKAPPGGSYAKARDATARMLSELRKDPWGLSALQEQMSWFARKQGVRRRVKAVELARHVFSIRLRGADLSGQERALVEHTLDTALQELRRARVSVASDLSWNADAGEDLPADQGRTAA